MSKFNTRANGSTASSPKSAITTTGPATTFEGGKAYSRDAKSDLFLLAVTNMVGEDTFYEKAGARDDRYAALVRQVTLEDPEWMYRFIGWLRNDAHMRSASIVAAAEAVLARREAGVDKMFDASVGGDPGYAVQLGTRAFIPQAMARADEPGEFMGYWVLRTGSKTLPAGVKRGLADAVKKLFNEYAYLKYGRKDGFQLADLVDLLHPSPEADWQGDLFRHALNERHKRGEAIPESLKMLRHHKEVMEMPQEGRRAFLGTATAIDRLKAAGITWEQLSGWLGGELDASFWESVIPSMGYMALLRNLRNFEKARISRSARKAVQERLGDPEQVRRSRQFPYRFLSAYRATQSDWWGETLSDALDASVGNLPVFSGRTLVLVDTSASMNGMVSAKSSVRHVDVGALIGVALAASGSQVDLHGFAGGGGWRWDTLETPVQFKHELPKGGSILRGVESFTRRVGEVGHGTQISQAYKESFRGHDRVILVSDMQSFNSYDGDISTMAPKTTRIFGINTSGYAATVVDSAKPNRFEVGGFSDRVFEMIRLIEAGDGGWPF